MWRVNSAPRNESAYTNDLLISIKFLIFRVFRVCFVLVSCLFRASSHRVSIDTKNTKHEVFVFRVPNSAVRPYICILNNISREPHSQCFGTHMEIPLNLLLVL